MDFFACNSAFVHFFLLFFQGIHLHILQLDVKFVLAELEEVPVLVLEVLWILKLVLEATHFAEDLLVCIYLFWLELLFQRVDELDLHLGQLVLIDVLVAIRVSHQDEIIQLLLRLRCPQCLLLKGQHIVDLVFFEGLDQGSLVGLQEQSGHKLCESLRLHELHDVDLLVELIDRFFIAIILKLALPPPSGLSSRLAAATAEAQEPRHDILVVAVEEFSFLNHGAIQVIDSILVRIDLWLVIVTLGRGRKDAAGERGLKFEILKRSDHKLCAHPDQ